MCPLRIILIFLSASLAGFFALRNFKSNSIISSATDTPVSDADDSPVPDATSGRRSSSKVHVAFVNGFWTFVDMASGRYLWRNLVSVSKKSD